MSIGIWQVVLILLIILILFGAGKLPKVMGDIAEGLRNFKVGIRENDEVDKTVLTSEVGKPELAHVERDETGTRS
jgi:sec-independent protein translocase protein TatA